VVIKPNKTTLHLSKTAAPLLTRAAVFLSLFIIFSGIIGPRIISHGLVSKDGFEIYGGAGKSLLFGVISLLLLIYRSDKKVELKAWKQADGIWLVLAVSAIFVAWVGVSKLIAGVHGADWPLLVNLCIVLSIILAGLGTFGLENLKKLIKTYKRELLISIGLGAIFYVFLLLAYSLWQILATIVLHSVDWLLKLVGISTTLLPGHTLELNKFSITIAQYCSGIESIALFTGLYGLIGVLDWERFNHKKLLVLFPAALIILFLLNILRVFVLILGGYYINPQIAFSLFHTYAGMLFFIVYSLIFWSVSYQWILTD
jgi:exosortase/archaeosortase family protein